MEKDVMGKRIVVMDLRDAFYKAGDPRRRLEREDGRMIGNDHAAFANCPPDGFQRYFPGRPWRPTQE